MLAGGPGVLQRIIDEQAIIIADQKRALAAKTAELRAKLQAATDLVAAVPETLHLRGKHHFLLLVNFIRVQMHKGRVFGVQIHRCRRFHRHRGP